jgi:hypothetical protein
VNIENIPGTPPNILFEFGLNSTYNIQQVFGLSLDKRALLGGKVISSSDKKSI